MKVELFLDGNKVEISKDIDFVLNKQFTELSDLTSIIVDYSKTINIPMTAHNNELFNYIYKLDHQVLINKNIISYDPSQKIPMVMTYNGTLTMEGYAVLSSVNLKDKTYELNLYGQLGKIFSDLKDLTLKEYKSWPSLSMKMNTRSIEKSFLNDTHSLDWDSDDWTDFWGFAPQMVGSTDLMDCTTFEVCSDNSSLNFSDIINERRSISNGDALVGDGFDINNYGEVRSYLTRPYVYVDKLIQVVQNEINSNPDTYGGYTLELDDDWFNEDNPYYNDLCYFPGRETIVDNGEDVNGSVTWLNTERTLTFPIDFLPSTASVDLDGFTYSTSGTTWTINTTDGTTPDATLALDCNGIVIRDRVNGVKKLSNFNTKGKWAYYNLDNSNIIPVRYIGIYDNENNLIYKLVLCDDTVTSSWDKGSWFSHNWGYSTFTDVWSMLKKVDSKIMVPNNAEWVTTSSSEDYCQVTQTYNFGDIVLNRNSAKFRFGCDLINFNTATYYKQNISKSEYSPLCPYKNDDYDDERWKDSSTWQSYFMPIPSLTVSSQTYRSGSTWTINEIIGDDFIPFTWLIDYVKKFRLFFDIDYNTKKITLSAGYFGNITYKDVNVDYSKEITINPIINEYNYVTYGYADNESKKGAKYKNRNDVNYGDMEISTGIDITDEEMTLIPDEDESVFIPVSTASLTWDNLSCNWPTTPITPVAVKYSTLLQTSKVINTLDKDSEIQYFPFFAFRTENKTSATSFYTVSDDSPTMKNNGEYTYLDHRTKSQTGESTDWYEKSQGTQEGSTIPYLLKMYEIPQFDNYIEKTVEATSIIANSSAKSATVTTTATATDEVDLNSIVLEVTENPTMDPETITYTDMTTEEVSDDDVEYTNPVTKRKSQGKATSSTVTLLYWATFGVPVEVYNGNIPNNIESYSVYNRWKHYLNEIFNVNNKKVTCYIHLTYPDFISFKFNTLFVIDNNVFLVNKIIDFNPNNNEGTQVELLQITDADNLE